MSTINTRIMPINWYQQTQTISNTNQTQQTAQTNSTSGTVLYNNNYELEDLLPNWQYIQYTVTGSANASGDCSKMADDKVQEYYAQFKHQEISYNELIEKVQKLAKKYPTCILINIEGYTAEIKTSYSLLYAVDPTEDEILILRKKYLENKIGTVELTKELEKMNGVTDVELNYNIPSLEQINFTVNGKRYNFSKSRTGFDFDKKNNIAHGPSVFQELASLGFSKAEINQYFKKLERVKAAKNEYSFKMRDDIHIQGRLITDLMELRDLVVIKRLQEDVK